jgi:pyruvate-formate lyase-activating enzyme
MKVVSPFVMSLNRIDYWYWCRYFIDVYPECPFGCSYCHTACSRSARGLNYIRGLPKSGTTIGLGLLSDLYAPVAGHERAARSVLEILLGRGHVVSIQTKSTNILHDIDILKQFVSGTSARVTLTLLTPDETIAKRIEGSAPSPKERLEILALLSEADIPAGIAITPIIPSLNDSRNELSSLVAEAKKRGARWVLFSGFTPVSSFLKQSGMQGVRAIVEDQELMTRRNSEIKRFMVDLLREEELPVRIPRPVTGPPDQHYHAHVVSEHLFNISYYHELLGNTVDAARFRRAAHHINDMEASIKSIVFRKKLGYIKGINPEIEHVIEEIIMTGNCALSARLKEKL